MAPISDIYLTDNAPAPKPVKILQLHDHLELFSEGDPPFHSLFILGQSGSLLAPLLSGTTEEQLLIIDPPLDLQQRFRLPQNSAALFTFAAADVGIPLIQTQPDGVAHVRIGEHFLDIYTEANFNIVVVPALGILCTGAFGSDVLLPKLGAGSDGENELAVLRLLARLLKQHRLQFFIPATGHPASDPLAAMQRLAADVDYLHRLRRVVPAAAQRQEPLASLQATLAPTLLPVDRRSPPCQTIHRVNIATLYNQARHD
jgi:hypothetical protein